MITINEMINKFLESENAFDEGLETIINSASMLSREFIVGDVDSALADALVMLIRFWNKKDDEEKISVKERKPIKLYISSYGGELNAAYSIINAIELSSTPVWTIAVGPVYSAGFFIFITGHKRLSYPLASFLFHEGSTGTESVDAHKFRNHAEFYSKQLKQLKQHTLKYTNLTEEDYVKVQKDDYWLTAAEALDKGMVDHILERGEGL